MRLYISETVCGCTRMAVVATLGVALALAANSMIQQRTTPSVGFEALVFREGPKATWTDHWGNAFIVQIDSKHAWSLNGRAVSPTGLEQALGEQLCRRTQRVILFDASPHISYGEAVQAIDTIHSARPTYVAVITPEMKKIDSDRFYLKKP